MRLNSPWLYVLLPLALLLLLNSCLGVSTAALGKHPLSRAVLCTSSKESRFSVSHVPQKQKGREALWFLLANDGHRRWSDNSILCETTCRLFFNS
jgi:hypothetical protein